MSDKPGRWSVNHHHDAAAGLRRQVVELARQRIGRVFADHTPVDRLVDALCADAFIDCWEEGLDTRILRTAAEMLRTWGTISPDAPEVT